MCHNLYCHYANLYTVPHRDIDLIDSGKIKGIELGKRSMKRAIVNFTPHDVNIYLAADCEYDEKTRKLVLKKGATPIQIFPKSGNLLNAEPGEASLLEDVFYAPPKWKGIDLPPVESISIVSNLYLTAYRETIAPSYRHGLATVGDVVYSDTKDPRPVGCLKLYLYEF